VFDQRNVRVSYIISTRNRADFLDKALANVREFIEPEDELLVIDGASTDHTAQIVEKHRDIVSFFLSEPDCGEAHGFNKGMLASHGRYIKFLSDDDYIFSEAMRDAIAVMEQHPDVDAVLCGGEFFDLDAATQELRLSTYTSLAPSCGLATDRAAALRYLNCGLGLILTRRCLSRVGVLDTTFRSVDSDYISRLITCGVSLRYLNVKLYSHTTYPHSGVQQRSECYRDAVRAYQRLGDWERVMDFMGDDPAAVADPWGLLQVGGGASLWRLLWFGEKLRRRHSRLLPFVARLLEVGVRLLRYGRRSVRWCWRMTCGVGPAGGIAPTALSAEPMWDMSLR
jgi:glycosyltransferase involved in cell wall biosynthesis